ncbi:conjugal transfer protein [Bartonella tribocorum]|uniref:Conjugal transfer protein n=1 Tax=Bartonella tribocorum TaxID=85701 RepID=A0A2M6UWE8_9HYPH|nr:conjugal transfer protein [Bartonella tribocorum]PIT70414.1 conjugal transfer protein [Bartonella tribocorum]
MKKLDIFRLKLDIFRLERCDKISIIVVTLVMLLISRFVHAQTITKNLEVFIGMQYGLSVLIPIVAAVLILFFLLIYLFRIITRATFMRWAFSVIIAGAAFYITNILFYLQS